MARSGLAGDSADAALRSAAKFAVSFGRPFPAPFHHYGPGVARMIPDVILQCPVWKRGADLLDVPSSDLPCGGQQDLAPIIRADGAVHSVRRCHVHETLIIVADTVGDRCIPEFGLIAGRVIEEMDDLDWGIELSRRLRRMEANALGELRSVDIRQHGYPWTSRTQSRN